MYCVLLFDFQTIKRFVLFISGERGWVVAKIIPLPVPRNYVIGGDLNSLA